MYSVFCIVSYRGSVAGLIDVLERQRDDGGDQTNSINEVRWCQLNSGPTTVTDRNGRRHTVHVSVRRDGSVWARIGRSSMDWTAVDERQTRIQTALLDDDAISALQVIDVKMFLTFFYKCVKHVFLSFMFFCR